MCFCVMWKHSALIKNWNSKKKNTLVEEEISSALIKQFLPGIGVPDSSQLEELEEAYIQVKMKAIQQVYLIFYFCLFSFSLSNVIFISCIQRVGTRIFILFDWYFQIK